MLHVKKQVSEHSSLSAEAKGAHMRTARESRKEAES